jgi:bifunctional pyridoxal-dependent enzyme with beta-cystathionase and maltose regulon repressor activities
MELGGDRRSNEGDSSIKLDSKMREYVNARKEYTDLLKSIYAETDVTKRAALIAKLEKQNEKLVAIAAALRNMWNSLTRNDRTNRSISDLDNDLEKYKQDIQSLQSANDEHTRLTMVYTDMNSGVVKDRATYFVHIIVVFILCRIPTRGHHFYNFFYFFF